MQNHKRILKKEEENKLKNQNLKQERAITLVALVVTVIVLIILATITITIVVGENGLINRAQQAKTLQENAKDKEELDMILLGYNLSNKTKKANNESTQELKDYLLSEGATSVKEKGENLIVTFKGQQYTVNPNTLASGTYQTEGLNATDEEKVVNALKSETKLLTVDYEPTPTDSTYIVPDKYSGVDTSQDDLTVGQNFTQADLLGTGNDKLKWYVLSTDEDGVNLVSDVTISKIKFADSPGYDNCLYYLDKVSKEFFSNENQYGVTKDRVHALRLTDIKKAAEQMNAGYRVGGERDWNWDTDFISWQTRDPMMELIELMEECEPSDKYYPGMYSNEGGVVNCKNPLYDEEIIENPVTNDTSIIARGQAAMLKLNYTYIYFSSKATQMEKLGKGITGTFGNSKIGDTLFTGIYWLASRCIYVQFSDYGDYSTFNLRAVNNGMLASNSTCNTSGNAWSRDKAFRIVVSVPASHINVADDGTVSLK